MQELSISLSVIVSLSCSFFPEKLGQPYGAFCIWFSVAALCATKSFISLLSRDIRKSLGSRLIFLVEIRIRAACLQLLMSRRLKIVLKSAVVWNDCRVDAAGCYHGCDSLKNKKTHFIVAASASLRFIRSSSRAELCSLSSISCNLFITFGPVSATMLQIRQLLVHHR